MDTKKPPVGAAAFKVFMGSLGRFVGLVRFYPPFRGFAKNRWAKHSGFSPQRVRANLHVIKPIVFAGDFFGDFDAFFLVGVEDGWRTFHSN